MSNNKVKVAIIVSGNIRTDLMIKVLCNAKFLEVGMENESKSAIPRLGWRSLNRLGMT